MAALPDELQYGEGPQSGDAGNQHQRDHQSGLGVFTRTKTEARENPHSNNHQKDSRR